MLYLFIIRLKLDATRAFCSLLTLIIIRATAKTVQSMGCCANDTIGNVSVVTGNRVLNVKGY